MNEQIKKVLTPLIQFWSNASAAVKRVVVGLVIFTVVVALVLSILLNSNEYVVIYENISAAESTEILAELQNMDVKVKTGPNGSIMVPEKDESRVRMALATAGYPKSGLSYYLIEENSGMLTTDYERKQYMNMQLQERIAASIRTLEGVRDAVVTITIPESRMFYLQETEKPTASVIIHMKTGCSLTESQVFGIQNLVAKAVTGLTKDNIALTDSFGNDLIGEINSNHPDFAKINLTREIENDIRKKITDVLLGPYKQEKFTISVTATIDTDALVTEQTTYIPSQEGNNTGVISEESRSDESFTSAQGDGGIAGTSSNSQIPTYPTGGTTGESSSSSSSENIKYQVSQIKSQTQKSGARIESISIGIAIDKRAFEPGERESVTQLVAYAAGVDPENITVQNFQFYKEESPLPVIDTEQGLNKMILFGGIAAGVLLLAGITAFILMRKRRKEELEISDSAETGQDGEKEELDSLFGEKINEVKPITPVKDVRREEIKEFAKSNPEIAAQMIRSWLRSEE